MPAQSHHKQCTECGEEKPLSNFYVDTRFYTKKNGSRSIYFTRRSKCKSCNIERSKKRYRENPEDQANRNLKYKYGLP